MTTSPTGDGRSKGQAGEAPLRCVIVDDNLGFLQMARVLLEADGIAIVGEATDGRQARRLITELRPDVMLVDYFLGEENGFDLITSVHRDGPHGHGPGAVLDVRTRGHEPAHRPPRRDPVADVDATISAFLGKVQLLRSQLHRLDQATRALDDKGPVGDDQQVQGLGAPPANQLPPPLPVTRSSDL